MIKYIALLKRRPGLSFDEFKEYYESRHAVLGREHLFGAIKYQRRYLLPMGDPFLDGTEGSYDCLLEVWFKDQAGMDTSFAHLAEPDIAKLFEVDEEKIFDRSQTRSFVTDTECESELA